MMLVQDAKPVKGVAWQTAARWLDQSLHLVVAEYCGNLSMREIIRRCWSYKRLSYEAGNDSDSHLREGWKQHAVIIQALEEKNGDEATASMAAHLQSAGRVTSGGRIV